MPSSQFVIMFSSVESQVIPNRVKLLQYLRFNFWIKGGSGVFWPKMLIQVLFLLMFRPDHFENLSKHSKAFLMFFLFSLSLFFVYLRQSVRSSAYVSFSFLFPFIVSYGVAFEFCIYSVSILMHSTNKQPAMGSPCLQPLRILNCEVGKPFTTLTSTNLFWVGVPFSFGTDVLPSRIFIHLQKFFPKPKISRVSWINLMETESKAFSKSTRTARPGFLVLIAYSKISQQFLVASEMNLLGIYAF